MKIVFEISDKHLEELKPFLKRNSSGEISLMKGCIKKAYWNCIYAFLESGTDISAKALMLYLEGTTRYELMELEKGSNLDIEDFIELLDKNRL
jgi:hypothetical protein